MKFRLTLTAQKEYEVDSRCYPEEVRDDPEKMLMIDMGAIEDDPELFLKGATLRIHGEIINS